MTEKQREKQLDTEELMRLLQNTATLNKLLKSTSVVAVSSLSEHLAALMEKHSITAAQVIQKAVLSKAFGYQIFNGTRHPSRDVLLRIAVVMKLDVEETQRLLAVARHGKLYPKIRRDAAVVFCIQNKYTLEQSSELLEGIEELPLL